MNSPPRTPPRSQMSSRRPPSLRRQRTPPVPRRSRQTIPINFNASAPTQTTPTRFFNARLPRQTTPTQTTPINFISPEAPRTSNEIQENNRYSGLNGLGLNELGLNDFNGIRVGLNLDQENISLDENGSFGSSSNNLNYELPEQPGAYSEPFQENEISEMLKEIKRKPPSNQKNNHKNKKISNIASKYYETNQYKKKEKLPTSTIVNIPKNNAQIARPLTYQNLESRYNEGLVIMPPEANYDYVGYNPNTNSGYGIKINKALNNTSRKIQNTYRKYKNRTNKKRKVTTNNKSNNKSKRARITKGGKRRRNKKTKKTKKTKKN